MLQEDGIEVQLPISESASRRGSEHPVEDWFLESAYEDRTFIEDLALLERRNIPIQRYRKGPGIRETVFLVAPTVTIQGYQYLVDFGNGNPTRFHRVNKNKECSCGAPYCEAIEAVRLYLQSGGHVLLIQKACRLVRSAE
jgi:hypothetical protein